jgi:hypothetical protein
MSVQVKAQSNGNACGSDEITCKLRGRFDLFRVSLWRCAQGVLIRSFGEVVRKSEASERSIRKRIAWY